MLRSAFLVAAALSAPILTAPSLTAQNNCPMQTTRRVALDVLHGPPNTCGGIDLSLGNVQVTRSSGPCPLFVVVTPAHDEAVPSHTYTYVESMAIDAVQYIGFTCKRDYFLFIPLGTSCVPHKPVVAGSVQQLLTRPCPILEGQ